jgi:DNA topoisomerase-1
MKKKLIIVESPTKAKTIKNFLDKKYDVVASKGHIRDLPKSSFGIKIEDGKFKPIYKIDKEHQEIVKKIKALAQKSKEIYIATDEDREGEAIGYHIAKAIGEDPQELPRIVFHEVTKKAILNALDSPRKLDVNKINAQQARRLLDRIVGYKLSPLLGSKIQKGLSAGRVQSAALKLIVDREREIKKFVPREYWSIEGEFSKSIKAVLIEYNQNKLHKFSITNSKKANEIEQELENKTYFVRKIDKKEKSIKTPPPFMTSTLQQNASTVLGFSPKKTMMIAQRLHEGVQTPFGITGVITYMRTDSLNVAKESIEEAREYIKKNFSLEYLPEKPKTYQTKSKLAQEAHEAIRPTILDFVPFIAKEYLSSDEYKLYKLIFDRFIASQMSDAKIQMQTVLIATENGVFKATGKRVKFDGFYKIYGEIENDKVLPPLQEGEQLILKNINSIQHFTEPPNRYNEASLIKKLESLGIGRPSTYAPIIAILQNRGYVEVKKRQLIPTAVAFKVIEVLEKHFFDIVDSSFTAKMEEELDEIAAAKKDWQEVLKKFYDPFIELVYKGKKEIKSQKVAKPTGEFCPLCGAELVERDGKYGKFIACSAYPKCKYTKNISEHQEIIAEEKCEKCGGAMVVKNGKNGKFLGCSNYPKCNFSKPLPNNKPDFLKDVVCPECKGRIVQRFSKKGKFFGCENYPNCSFVSKYEPVNRYCKKCGYLMAKRLYRKKEIVECIKCKEKEEIE